MTNILLVLLLALSGCSMFRPKPMCQPVAVQMCEPDEMEYWDPELMIAEHDE